MDTITKNLIENSLLGSMSYIEYRDLVSKLAKEGKSTGPNQTKALGNYTQLNDRRMKRWDKTLKFSDEVVSKIKMVQTKTTWLVITESWCGDASPALPVFHKITTLNSNINLKIVLRDENIDLMNQFLTHGSMSIPKLIALDSTSKELLYDWGPRSSTATKLVEAYKAENSTISAEFKQDLQLWYNKDKGQSILDDILAKFSLK